MTDQDDKIYLEIFAETYNLLKSCLPVLDTDDYWQAAMAAAHNLYRQYRDTAQGTLAKALILDAVSELDRIARAQDTKGEDQQ